MTIDTTDREKNGNKPFSSDDLLISREEKNSIRDFRFDYRNFGVCVCECAFDVVLIDWSKMERGRERHQKKRSNTHFTVIGQFVSFFVCVFFFWFVHIYWTTIKTELNLYHHRAMWLTSCTQINICDERKRKTRSFYLYKWKAQERLLLGAIKWMAYTTAATAAAARNWFGCTHLKPF